MANDTSDTETAAFDRAFAQIHPPGDPWQPRKVFLFSGHLIDAPGRPEPRFPNGKAGLAADKIDAALASLGADASDLALTQGASGGDLLFAEACARRGLRIHLLQPFAEEEFIKQSILPSVEGESWKARYLALTAQLQDRPRAMPDALGPLPEGMDPYERCNLWLLHTALAWGVEKTHFICLWNGGGGDGPGGTAHMYNEVNSRTGQVVWLDTRELW
jgi:hypothetical protein